MLTAALGAWQRWKPTGNAGPDGYRTSGEYRNPYLGFRVPFGDGWQDVTDALRTPSASGSGAVLLALDREGPAGGDSGVSVIVFTSPFPTFAGIASGADYLRRAVKQLGKGPDPPADVKEEPRATIAGIPFDRVSFKRPRGDVQVGVTNWATVRRGKVVLITATYGSPEMLRRAEELLADAAPDSGE
jgi:hypothetical protein